MFHTNHAVALEQAGQGQAARAAYERAVAVAPNDSVAVYLYKREQESFARAKEQEALRQLEMIRQLSEQVQDSPESKIPAHSAPLVVVFQPPEFLSGIPARLGKDQLWCDRLSSALRKDAVTTVDRQNFSAVLRELGLSHSKLSPDDEYAQLGKLLPASILAKPLIDDDADTVWLKLIGVETTETLDLLEVPATQKPGDTASQLVAALRDTYAVHGRITSVHADTVHINIGLEHGIRANDELIVHSAGSTTEPRDLRGSKGLGKAKVEAVSQSTATISLTLDVPVTEGMRVTLPAK